MSAVYFIRVGAFVKIGFSSNPRHPDPAWFDVITAAVTKFETTAAEMVAAYTQATTGLPPTERVPDYNTVELKTA